MRGFNERPPPSPPILVVAVALALLPRPMVMQLLPVRPLRPLPPVRRLPPVKPLQLVRAPLSHQTGSPPLHVGRTLRSSSKLRTGRRSGMALDVTTVRSILLFLNLVLAIYSVIWILALKNVKKIA
jgi:hypothetical protein